MAKLNILVSGMMSGNPHQGGATWVVLPYLLGLRRLGHEVAFAEPVPVGDTPLDRSAQAAYFRSVARDFGLEQELALLRSASRETVGISYDRLHAFARRADVLLNISGMLREPDLVERIPVRVYLDVDPAFNQLWHAQGIDRGFAGHTHWATVGLALNEPDCKAPRFGLHWITTLPPVLLEHWPVAERIIDDAFTTVANWRGYGSIEHDGVVFGQKAHSLRRFITLPTRAGAALRLALAIHPDETRDLQALAQHGWQLVDPARVAGTPADYRRFIQGSRAEFGIAKSGYVVSRCGWFSDRSVCYLASGRPVLAQETGIGRFLPTGAGLLTFESMDDILVGIDAILTAYDRHARAARALAEEYFDSDKVLSRLLHRIGVAP